MKNFYRFVGIKGKEHLPMEMKIIYLYRYFSLFLTSFFYISENLHSLNLYKYAVLIGIGVSAVISNYIYLKHENDKKIIELMIIIETIGNIIILVPTGGLNSPYIWYSLNTILVAVCFSKISYFCLSLFIYTAGLAVMTYCLFDKWNKTIYTFIISNSNLLLSYVLIIIAIQSLMVLVKKLGRDGAKLMKLNEELIEANVMIKDSVEHIAALYETINSFINIKNKSKLAEILIKYTKDITKSDTAFSFVKADEGENLFKLSGKIAEKESDELRKFVEDNLQTISDNEGVFGFNISGKKYAAVPVISLNGFYGIIGIESGNMNEGIIKDEKLNQLKFFATLSSIMFERFNAEELNRRLIIADEQNRIASEMHDSVCQMLFFTASKVHSIIQSQERGNCSNINTDLAIVKNSINRAAKELREVIYSYSIKSRNKCVFEEGIEYYIKEIENLNKVNIRLDLSGSQELISFDMKKIIYRFIYECTGNAIRHGKCSNINISIIISSRFVDICIDDDGIGFDVRNKIQNRKTGLGINNLYNLVYSCSGNISIESKNDKGTVIKAYLPNVKLSEERGEVV